ncbi:MAG: MerR family transcriptional regulator [Candidatus Geothermincolia bacterium]
MSFTPDQAAALCGCTRSQLRYWHKTGLVEPSRVAAPDRGHRYSFENLVELRTISQMLCYGISLQKIRKTVSYISQATSDERPLASCKLVTDGSTVFEVCASDGELIDTLKHGQIAFCVALDAISREMQCKVAELEADRSLFIESLLDQDEPRSRREHAQ